MRTRAILVLAAIFLSAALPARSHGATFVSVSDNAFNPSPAQIEPNHDVTWTWTCSYNDCSGTHNVTAFEGASFASENLSYPATYTVTMGAAPGMIRYRCTLHSTLAGGRCNGMCGILGEDAAAPVGTIEDPTADEVVLGATIPVPVTISGTARDDAGLAGFTVRLFEVQGRASDHPAACTAGCGTTEQSWAVTVSLLPGSYLAEVAVVDTSTNQSRSPRTRFFVL